MKVTYKILSKFYDLIDVIYFRDNGENPRKAILNLVSDEKIKVLDMCCGTMGNSIGIAKQRKNAEITGVDISAEMLEIGQNKIEKENISNARIHKCDATNTKLPDKSFDVVIIGLVLHECEKELAEKILSEASRVLKNSGKIIILEWEESQDISKRVLFFPVKHLEPKPFKTFFVIDKKKYFEDNGFVVSKMIHCDYSCVYELKIKNNF